MGQAARSAAATTTGHPFVKVWPKISDSEIKEMVKSIAVCFYSCNLPHSLIEHEAFKHMLLTCAPFLAGKLPTRKLLSTTLLDQVYEEVKAEVQEWLDNQASTASSR